MIFGPRPNLGWLGYYFFQGSWYKMGAVMVLLAFATLSLIDRSKHMIRLQYTLPAPFPPPIVFLAPPSHGSIDALDACSVEAAVIAESSVPRLVYVYLWESGIGKGEVWGQFLASFKKVHLARVDLRQTVEMTPLEDLATLAQHPGWTGEQPDWMMWTGARTATLWAAGGVVIPLGVVTTNSVSVDPVRPPVGILLEGRNNTINPLLLATPAHHAILFNLATDLVEKGRGGKWLEEELHQSLLTKGVFNACDILKVEYLPGSECSDFMLLPKETVVEIDFNTQVPDKRVKDKLMLLKYKGEKHHLQNIGKVHHLFEINHLNRFCPSTTQLVEAMTRQSL